MQALDALKLVLSYPGWERDVASVEAWHLEAYSFSTIDSWLANIRRKQQAHSGDRSHPITRALDALTPTLTYPGWEQEARCIELCQYSAGGSLRCNDSWTDDLACMCEKQRVHEGDRSHPTLQSLDAHIKWLAGMMTSPSQSTPPARQASPAGFDCEGMPAADLIQVRARMPRLCAGLLVYPPDFYEARFRQLALRLHPDKESHPDAEQAFILVRAAYLWLKGAA
ncbi:hypothetical protein T492DRAFT_843784 [Pavlovales sp. CCMP2436]|nr:hypothetical protein T492DRAFT_843784 [Pavlovales sp. CCMP2436]